MLVCYLWSDLLGEIKIRYVLFISSPSMSQIMRTSWSNLPKYIYHISKKNIQWQIQGRTPLFLDRTETRRAEKFFLETTPIPALSKSLDDLASLLLSRSGSGTDIDFFFGDMDTFPSFSIIILLYHACICTSPAEYYWFESSLPPFGNSSLGTDFPFKIISFLLFGISNDPLLGSRGKFWSLGRLDKLL